MTVDFTRIFDNPDELADFLMLTCAEQDALLAEAAGNDVGITMACNLEKKQWDEKDPHA